MITELRGMGNEPVVFFLGGGAENDPSRAIRHLSHRNTALSLTGLTRFQNEASPQCKEGFSAVQGSLVRTANKASLKSHGTMRWICALRGVPRHQRRSVRLREDECSLHCRFQFLFILILNFLYYLCSGVGHPLRHASAPVSQPTEFD